jgi:hypothetical protein
MTREITPDNRNRVALVIGRIFHPYLICIPTLFAVLEGFSWASAIQWTLLILTLVLGPGLSVAFYLKRRGRFVYQRTTRTPLYLIGWASVLVCLAVLKVLNAPVVLIACLAALAVWVPLQLLINTFVTKLSAHAAVAAGCYTTLLLLGRLDSQWLQVGLLALVVLTLWSRIATRNHSLSQVVLGLLLGTLPVLLVFPLILG